MKSLTVSDLAFIVSIRSIQSCGNLIEHTTSCFLRRGIPAVYTALAGRNSAPVGTSRLNRCRPSLRQLQGRGTWLRELQGPAERNRRSRGATEDAVSPAHDPWCTRSELRESRECPGCVPAAASGKAAVPPPHDHGRARSELGESRERSRSAAAAMPLREKPRREKPAREESSCEHQFVAIKVVGKSTAPEQVTATPLISTFGHSDSGISLIMKSNSLKADSSEHS